MGVFKNKVGRPTNEQIRRKNIFRILLVIIILTVFGFVCYKLDDKGIINIKEKIVRKDKEEKITVSEVKNIYNGVFSSDFDREEYLLDDLMAINSDENKTITAISNVLDEKESNEKYDSYQLLKNKLEKEGDNLVYYFVDGTSVIYDKEKTYVCTYEDVQNKLNEIYGPNVKLYKKYMSFYNYKIISIPDEEVFVLLESVWGDGGHKVLKMIDHANKNGKEVSFNLLIIDANYTGEEGCEYEFIPATENQMVCLTNEDIDDEEKTLTEYKDIVHEYKYIFKERKDGTYYFDKLEKLQ